MFEGNKYKKEEGFVILLTVLISSLVLFIGVSVYNILSNHFVMTRISKNSQVAFYAADAGIECALYWDFKKDGFSTSSNSVIKCNGDSYTVPVPTGKNPYIWTFYMNFEPDPYCTEVMLEKNIKPLSSKTKVESRGYNRGYDSSNNDCGITHPEKVQRSIKVKY